LSSAVRNRRRRHGLRRICRVVAANDDVAVLAIVCGVEGGGQLRLAAQPMGPQQYGGTADVGGIQRRFRVPPCTPRASSSGNQGSRQHSREHRAWPLRGGHRLTNGEHSEREAGL
jgi:hypothetical protein